MSNTIPVSTVNWLENKARSWYDAAYINLSRRYSSGLSLLANYTFAKNLSDAPDFRSPMFESAIPQNNNDLSRRRVSLVISAIVSSLALCMIFGRLAAQAGLRP